MHKCTCSLFTSAYFDMGLLMKVLEITWAKHVYAIYLSMWSWNARFASIGYLHGEGNSKNCHLNLSLSAVCDCGIS